MAQTMVAVLHNIRSMHNVGSMFRTADAAGIKKLYLCGYTSAPVDEMGVPRQQVAKVSLGAEKFVEWSKERSTAKVIDRLKQEGYAIIALEQSKRAIPYYTLKANNAKPKTAFVVGNEVRGLPASLLKQADTIIEIPMRGAMVRQAHHPRQTRRGKESLNVSVAFGIVVFEMGAARRT